MNHSAANPTSKTTSVNQCIHRWSPWIGVAATLRQVLWLGRENGHLWRLYWRLWTAESRPTYVPSPLFGQRRRRYVVLQFENSHHLPDLPGDGSGSWPEPKFVYASSPGTPQRYRSPSSAAAASVQRHVSWFWCFRIVMCFIDKLEFTLQIISY